MIAPGEFWGVLMCRKSHMKYSLVLPIIDSAVSPAPPLFLWKPG